MTEIGPVQLIAVGFGPQANFQGRVLAELVALEEKDTLRVLDLLFVHKDAESKELVVADYEGEEMGAIVGALLGFEFEGEPAADAEPAPGHGHAFGLTPEEIHAFGERLEPGHSAGFLLIEHVWARDLKRALRDAGGFPIGEGFLTPEAIAGVALELTAMAAAIEELEREQAAAAAHT
jgi:hypothetical protein